MQLLDPGGISGTNTTGVTQKSSTACPYPESGSEFGVFAEDRVINSAHIFCQVLPQTVMLVVNTFYPLHVIRGTLEPSSYQRGVS